MWGSEFARIWIQVCILMFLYRNIQEYDQVYQNRRNWTKHFQIRVLYSPIFSYVFLYFPTKNLALGGLGPWGAGGGSPCQLSVRDTK